VEGGRGVEGWRVGEGRQRSMVSCNVETLSHQSMEEPPWGTLQVTAL
jgi:hypothetical protein